MKIRTLVTLLAMAVFAVTSCEKEDIKLPFNELNPEANKQLVEDSAIEAAKAMDELKDEPAVDASVSLAMHLDMADPFENSFKKSKPFSIVNVVAGLDNDESGITDIFATVQSPGELTEDPETIEDIWNEAKGTYTWNEMTESWDFTENADAVVFEFPSAEEGTSNNATLTISNYTSVMVNSPLEEEYDGDLPTSLDIDFVVDGASVMSFHFAANYNADGIPEDGAADLNIGDFTFSIDGTNNDTEISANQSFTNGDQVILQMNGTLNGDFTDANIEENTHTYSDTYTWTDWVWNDDLGMYEEVEVTETDTWEEVDGEEIAQSGDFKVRLFDISIGGTGDIKAMVDSMDIIYPEDRWENENFDEKAATEAEARIMNSYLQIYAIDEASKQKIADVEAYVVEEVETWGDESWTYYWVDFRLVFGDGSLVDLETYFENGFDEFIAELNSMISELNSEYDMDFDPIDY
ncbi:hypothetical protein ACFLT1_02100 [Bacteroidota bacterium]